jgi:hypothetical protein
VMAERRLHEPGEGSSEGQFCGIGAESGDNGVT